MTGSVPRPPERAARWLALALRIVPAGRSILGDLHEDFVRVHREWGPAAARRWYWREAVPLGLSMWTHATLRRLAGALFDLLGPHGFREDAGSALRSLRRSPTSALFTAVVIALGVGAATAVYGIVEPIVLSPLPFDDAEELVWIASDAGEDDASLSSVTSRTANLHDFRERASTLQGITGYDAFFAQRAYTLTGRGEPERLVGVGVAHDFLDVLRIAPVHGRGFTVEEGRRGGPPAVILSHAFWERRFGGDPRIVGRAVDIDEMPRTVVGVLPETFDFSSVFTPGTEVDVLLPFPVLAAGEPGFQGNTLAMIGRLAPGETPGSAQAELDRILATLGEADPDRWGLGAEVTPLQAHVAGPFRTALLLLAAAAGALLLVVGLNAGDRVLVGRSGEVTPDVSRGRHARRLLLESWGVALVGAALGACLAWAVVRAVVGAGFEIPLLDRMEVGGSALLFAAALALLVGVAAGLVAALRGTGSRRSPGVRPDRRAREGLMVAQLALVCVLLVLGGLLARSFLVVQETDLGFDPAGVTAWGLDPGVDFDTHPEESAFYASLVERVERIPGVEGAGVIDALPMGRGRSWDLSVVGAPDVDLPIHPHVVDEGYQTTMRIPVVAGRDFTDRDGWDSPRVVVINETAARRVFGDERALGRKLRFWGPWEWEVVGIVGDVRHVSAETPPGPEVYFPLAQMPDFESLDLAVRSSLSPPALAGAVAAAIREADPSMPTGESWSLAAAVDGTTSARRLTLGILGGCGLAALLLVGLGIHDVATRSAAGPRWGSFAWGALGRTIVLSCVGIALGAALSLPAARRVEPLLYGVEPTDPVAFGAVALVLLVVALVSGALPARRRAVRPD